MLTYPLSAASDDFFLMKSIAAGKVQIDGQQLTLYPSSATTTRKDPRYPGDDYTDRQEPLTPKRFTWAVADGVLTLTDADDLQFVFQRVES
ncbi:hypothetical protein [Streptomyces sp. SID12501]|uniref:Uncharacterized protein n=1 Tax=Streptomyces sp. SID12501 TaxID=2706042 RepID=A0A6B3BV51_9ACTN|nr:hypothetical protein [Streptomyces sp. SID12501]NEC88235.1 hypothetical protein [Streptomyces sp. SID12501]